VGVDSQVMRWHRVTGLLLGCLLPPPGAAKLKPGSLPPSIDKLTASTCLALGYEVTVGVLHALFPMDFVSSRRRNQNGPSNSCKCFLMITSQ
jgi:hypothetical protein